MDDKRRPQSTGGLDVEPLRGSRRIVQKRNLFETASLSYSRVRWKVELLLTFARLSLGHLATILPGN
jgi:hypothetical protein